MAGGAIPAVPTPPDGALMQVLAEARRSGFLGPGDSISHVRHAEGLARVVEDAIGSAGGPAEFCDLGSGGGVPGLVMLRRWADARCTLIEVGRRRCQALREAVDRLGEGDRCRTLEGRAEDLGRDPDVREHFPVVIARSFDRPAVTAEVAAALVAVGGLLVVSEPPEGPVQERWPAEHLAELGFAPARVSRSGAATAAVILKSTGVGDRWPRRVGVPAKRPLW